MYTIKQAAARAGVAIPTVRAWERRYGVVHPVRTASGYRLYDDGAVARLIAMRHLMEDQGLRASQAAKAVVEAGDDLDGLKAASAFASPLLVTNGARSAEAANAFVDAARSLDVGAMDAVLDDAFAAERFEVALEHVVFPALRAIGDGWAGGSVDVAMEHAASETIRRRLAHFFDAGGRSMDPPEVIVGLPPGAHHEIGALAFAVAARRLGLAVLYLGADVPVESWSTVVEDSGASVAVIAVSSAADATPIADIVAALGATTRAPITALGGARAEATANAVGAIALPRQIDEAALAVRALLAGTPSG
jgi:DNA-binding transcriptional MerR regulator/methylmalonyl-CoA mutase cobalamin-binding subunit